MDVFCEVCGKVNRGGSRYCVRCGAPLGKKTDADVSASETFAEGDSSPRAVSAGRIPSDSSGTSFTETGRMTRRGEASEDMAARVVETSVEPGWDYHPGYVPAEERTSPPETTIPLSPGRVAVPAEEPPRALPGGMPAFLVERERKGFPLKSLLIASGVLAVVSILAVVFLLVLPGRSGREKVVIPDLSGMSAEDAGARLKELGLKIGEVSYRETADAAPGTVVSTDPGAGSELEKGTSVDLVVAAESQGEKAESEGKTVCPECFGRGYVICPKCQGRVYLSDGSICDLCHGKREILCPTCFGTGYVEK